MGVVFECHRIEGDFTIPSANEAACLAALNQLAVDGATDYHRHQFQLAAWRTAGLGSEHRPQRKFAGDSYPTSDDSLQGLLLAYGFTTSRSSDYSVAEGGPPPDPQAIHVDWWSNDDRQCSSMEIDDMLTVLAQFVEPGRVELFWTGEEESMWLDRLEDGKHTQHTLVAQIDDDDRWDVVEAALVREAEQADSDEFNGTAADVFRKALDIVRRARNGEKA